MAVSEEVGLLIRTIRGSMGEAAGEFRRAARSSESMSRIVRDISNVFAAQRRDLAELQNTLSESAFESEQSSSKLDHLSSLFREMISVQNSTLGELRDIDRGIREVDKDIYSLRYILMSQDSTLSGITSAVTAAGSSIVEKLGTFALGGAAGVAAAGAMGAFSGGGGGGGGESSGPQSSGAGGKFSASQAAALIRKVGGTEEEATVLGAISQPESGGNPNIRNNNPRTGDDSYGLWQINMLGKMGPERLKKYNLSSAEDLKNPETNARVALQMLREAHGVPKDWTTWKNNKHLKYMEAARAGATGKAVAQNNAKPENTTQTPQTTPSTTTPKQEAAQTSTQTAGGDDKSASLKPEEMGGHGHGPISGPLKDAEKMNGSGALPSGDIVALGKSLEKMGIRVSEHPSFGGVHPEKHYPNSAHNDGVAIDINAPGGITEANDPVWGPKFDQIAKQIQAAGYTVLWRTRGHDNHIHAQIGGKGIKGGHSIIGGAAGKDQTTDQNHATDASHAMQGATPVSASSPTTGMATTPSAQSATSEAPSGGVSSPAPEAPAIPQLAPLASALSQDAMPLMSGNMGAMGNIASMLMPAIEAISSQNAQMMEQPQNAEITQQLTEASMNNQIVSQAAVQQQAQQELAQESTANPEIPSAPNSPSQGVGSSSGNEATHGYNYPWDTSWPDWASMLGGWHYKEPQNIKKNMWS